MIEKVLGWIDRFSRAGAWLSALSMVAVVALISVEIGGRTLFSVSTLVADEFSGYLMVTVVMLGLGHTLAEDGHIRINILTGRLKGRPGQMLELVVTAVALAMGAFFLYHSVLMVYDSYSYDMRADSISETPVYLPQLVIPLGLLSLNLQLAARFLRRLLSSATP